MVRAVFMIRRVWVGDSVANTSRHSRFVFGKPDEFKQMSPKISGYDRSHTVTSNENKISHRWRERAVIITDWSAPFAIHSRRSFLRVSYCPQGFL